MAPVNFLFLLSWFTALGWFNKPTTEKEDTIDLRINCQECIGKYVSLTTFSMLSSKQKVFFRTQFDDSGITDISITSRDTLSVLLWIHENEEPGFDSNSWLLNTRLYLEPNKRLNVTFKDGDLTFEGRLANVNSYQEKIFEVNKVRVAFKEQHYDRVRRKSDDQEKEIYFSTIKSFGDALDRIIAADQTLTTYYKEFLTNNNLESVVTMRLGMDNDQENGQVRLMGVDKLDTEENFQAANGTTGPAIFSKLSINPHALKTNDSYYASLLRHTIYPKIRALLNFYYEHDFDEKISEYEYLKSAIAHNPKLFPNRDFVLALALTSDSIMSGIAYEDLDSIVKAFKKDYPQSNYLPELEDILLENGVLRNGMPLKDFSMQDSTGKEFNLSDLKGKLIYIDVWATWCRPCREEFKYSKELSKKYSNRSDLVFLYVSKDSKPKLWKRFLKKKPELRGTHGIQSPHNLSNDESDVMRLYKINGIPRYIMIGKDGRIINYNASRPSQLVENTELDSLLKI